MVKIETANGVISISTEVFTNIAGDAATRCFGVKGMAGKAKESGIYQLLRRESMSKGVFVSFNEDNTASIDLHIVVEHGINLATIGESIIGEVTYKVTEATGVAVKEVNVFIDGMVIG
ncbi:MAG: Asp23/Gls24 family envelope stress response protein [Oscillospiraceae bacterium]|nr:Asp23/Gls24 family envelope stress response protein [Oscillospiraceae bacterium]